MNRNDLEVLRQYYPPGTRIQCICMNDPFNPIPSGTMGEVDFIDDLGTIHMHWDNGSSLGLIPDEDDFIIIK